MNRLELRKQVRQHLAEAGTGQYTDETLNAQISRSARSIAGELGLILSIVDVASVGASLTLPSGVVNVVSASLQNNRGQLRLASAAEALSEDARAITGLLNGTPNMLIVDEAMFGPGAARLYPVPGDGELITLQAFLDGGDLLSDSDIPWGGRYDAYHDVIAYHAAHHLITRTGRSGSNDPTWFQRYQDRLENLRDRGSAGSLTLTPRLHNPIRRARWGGRYR